MKTRVQTKFSLNEIGEKIENFEELEFNEFLKSIHKKSDLKLSLKEQDEWQEYFDEKKEGIIKLEDQINKWNDEIDEIVYEMYEINDDEKSTIEANIQN